MEGSASSGLICRPPRFSRSHPLVACSLRFCFVFFTRKHNCEPIFFVHHLEDVSPCPFFFFFPFFSFAIGGNRSQYLRPLSSGLLSICHKLFFFPGVVVSLACSSFSVFYVPVTGLHPPSLHKHQLSRVFHSAGVLFLNSGAGGEVVSFLSALRIDDAPSSLEFSPVAKLYLCC